MMYLVLFDKVFGGLRGNIDRIFDDHFEAELYCIAQNDATTPMGKPPVTEHWVVVITLNEAGCAFADRVYKPTTQHGVS